MVVDRVNITVAINIALNTCNQMVLLPLFDI